MYKTWNIVLKFFQGLKLKKLLGRWMRVKGGWMRRT
jgi:hypothetical protein